MKNIFLSIVLLTFLTSVSYAQNLGLKLADGVSPNTTLDVNGAVSFREGNSLTLSNGANSDIALTDYSFFRVTGPTTAFSITGFAGGNDGRVLTIMNNTTQTMTLSHQTTSVAANQINTGGSNVVLNPSGIITLYYNTVLSKWVVTATTGAVVNLTNLTIGSYSDSLIVINNGVLGRVPPREYIETFAWGLDGNIGTTAGTNFLGTTDAQAMVIKTNNTERARISSAGYVGINNSTPIYRLHIEDPSGSDADILSRVYNNGVVTGIPGLLLQTASGTKAAPIRMPSGGQLGVIRWGGYDGSAFNDTWCAEIAAMATQNWTTTAHGTGMWFRTIQNDSTLSRARMVITHNGFVGLGFDSYSPQYKLDIDAQSGGTGNPLRLLGLNAGATSDSIVSSSAGILRRLSVNQVIANAWNITGNSGTVDGTNFIGTTDNIPLSIRVNNSKAGRIDHLIGNTTWGYLSGNVTTGIQNTFIGNQAGMANTTGRDNVALGYQALGTATTADNNTAIGSEALVFNTTGYGNVAIGRHSMRKNTTFYNNTAVGTYSLQENVGGYYNTAMGWSALNQNTSGFNNVGVGAQALLANTTGSGNIGVGMQSLYFNNVGTNNTSIGIYSMFKNESGNNNTALGYNALGANLTAWGNTAIGYQAAVANTTGQGIVAIGDSALVSSLTASGNTGLGYRAGTVVTTGSNNTFVGYMSDATSNALTNATALGANAIVGASNSLVLGGTGANAVNVGIGTTTPGANLEVKSTTALSTGVGVKFRSSTLDSVLTLGNDANFKFRNNSSYDFGTDVNNFISGYCLSSAGFRTFTPVYGRGFFGVESLLAAGGTTAASNYYGFRSQLVEEATHSTALNETYAGIFNFKKKGSGNYTLHQNMISNIILDGGSGTFTNAQAVVGQLTMGTGTANVTTANLFQANLGDWASGYSGTISNIRGLYVNYLGHARVQNAYGIFMEDVSGATSSNYAIYTKAGRVRLGDVPTATDADVVTIDGSGNLTKRSIYGVAWNLYGNSGTNPSSTFVGTTDAVDLAFRTNNTEQMRITSSGNVGIGTTSPSTELDINGGLTTRPGTTISLTADNQAVTVGNSSFIVLTSNNTTATNRTFTLSSGLQNGQILTILLTTNNAELVDGGNCALASTFSMTSSDTISLIWNGSTWYETSRSNN